MNATLGDFPDDDDGDALRRLLKDGDDLTRPRDIDFTVVFPNETAAQKFAHHFEQLGHKVSLRQSNCVRDLPWDVVVVHHIAPSYIEIVDFEAVLQAVAEPLGGRNDGWGCFAQKRLN